MPIQTTWINKQINENRLEDNKKESAKHVSSGKLSAGMLFQPVRFQVLKTLGVPRRPFDAYTLGVFEIGNDVEAKFVASLERSGALVKGKAVEAHGLTWDEDKDEAFAQYRDCVGYVDSVVDTSQMEKDWGVMPWECKSVTSYKLKHVKKTGVDWHHKLQAALYALAMDKEQFGVAIISKEHPDPAVHIFKTREMKRDVDQAISKYMEAMENWKKDRTLPVLEAGQVRWAVNPKYAMFTPEWFDDDTWAIKEMEKLNII